MRPWHPTIFSIKPTTAFLRDRQPPSLRLEDHERHVIACALLETGGNISAVTHLLGISRRTLHRQFLRWPDLAPKRTTAVERRVAQWRQLAADRGVKVTEAA